MIRLASRLGESSGRDIAALASGLKDTAPLVASTLLGPWAGVAVRLLEDALGVQGQGTQGINGALADPASEARLTALESDYGVKMAEAQKESTENARGLNRSYGGLIVNVLAVIYTVGFLGVCLLDVLGYVSDSSKVSQNMYSLAMLVAAYYFGSSIGERAS